MSVRVIMTITLVAFVTTMTVPTTALLSEQVDDLADPTHAPLSERPGGTSTDAEGTVAGGVPDAPLGRVDAERRLQEFFDAMPDNPTEKEVQTQLTKAQNLVDALSASTAAEALTLLTDYHDVPVAGVPQPLPPEVALTVSGIDTALLPPDLVEPVGTIWAALLVAQQLQQEATADLTAAEHALLDQVYDAVPEAIVIPSHVGPQGNGYATKGAEYGELRSVVDKATRDQILQKIDRSKMTAGAQFLMSTIEETIPRLPSLPANEPTPASHPERCGHPPELDLGVIAIDGTGSALFEDDYILSLDLGGDDCYNNTAGGARNSVRVAIDIAGNERYIHQSVLDGDVVAHGAADRGIGILVDVLGNDLYLAEHIEDAVEPGPIANSTAVIAQGAGTNVGIGLLADLAGADQFRILSQTSGNNVTGLGQGGGDGIGIGILSALGTSGTTYEFNGTSTVHQVIERPFYQLYLVGKSNLIGQGGGRGVGIGALVDLLGDDEYWTTALGGAGESVVQGGGDDLALGVLTDVDGDDLFNATSFGEKGLSLIVDDPSFCWSAFTHVLTKNTTIIGQGGARDLAIGIFNDALGGTANRGLKATSHSGALATTIIQNSASETLCENNAEAISRTGDAIVINQGAALGAPLSVGISLGALTDDDYNVTGLSRAHATALVEHGNIGVEFANATRGEVALNSHGIGATGIGLLVDVQGDDVYQWDANSTELEVTSTDAQSGQQDLVGLIFNDEVVGQGYARTGIGWLIDLDGTDEYNPLDEPEVNVAGNNQCWSHPTSPNTLFGKGWDLSFPYVTIILGCIP